ncbi:hypothetical protein [Paenibacillus lutrae]|uniref:Uncharacterized protein n=1 Tax=Paenibacillus lutrae TaxID=2078573 RepID=A0A7X3FIK9_9BACL|nr:hypothetical protein [Paenibacillus lutrae]MVP00388.1 hypothetical protein [Paenibacillus lutrae]
MKKHEMKPGQTGKIMETYKFGNSISHICDGYLAETTEEIEHILDNHQAAGWVILNKQYV